jgi:hypothetical protein
MLINCVVYQQGRKLLDIPVDVIGDYVSRPDRWTFGHPAALGLIATACGLLFWRFKQAGWL